MDAATAGLIGAALGFLGNALVTWINKHFDERKAWRELLIKSAWDYYSSRREIFKITGGKMVPFEVFLLYTVKTINLALRKNLSNEDILRELQEIHRFERDLIKVVKGVDPGFENEI